MNMNVVEKGTTHLKISFMPPVEGDINNFYLKYWSLEQQDKNKDPIITEPKHLKSSKMEIVSQQYLENKL